MDRPLGSEGEVTEDRPAFYALSPGGWRDWWMLLHPPYTIWHLSYVAIGAAVAPTLNFHWLAETLVAFFLALGLSAHALDELRGRPLRTGISDRALVATAVVGLVGALALGVDGALHVTGWIWLLMPIGVFLVLAYNLELFGGLVHTDLGFALAWGGFPAITGYVAQAGTLRPEALLVALGCVGFSAAQRALSTPARRLRRDVLDVTGAMRLRDGTSERLDDKALRAAPERALRLLSLAVPLLAIGLVVARV
jgi:hypothetical protein